MISIIKSLTPAFIKDTIRPIKNKTFDVWHYNYLLRSMPVRHKKLIEELKNKEKIRVAFLVYEKSKWKVDDVFQLMQQDALFSPFVIVLPLKKWNLEDQKKKVKENKCFFEEKGYETYSHFDDHEVISQKLNGSNMVFFTEPYNEAKMATYYFDLFRKKLCLYIPYFFMATNHVRTDKLKFNGINYHFLLSMWKIYWPHEEIGRELEAFDKRIAKNSRVTGYPSMEYLYSQLHNATDVRNSWHRNSEHKIKIIYAPHHAIFEGENILGKFSTFLENANMIRNLAFKNKDKIAWSFKPHPTLLKNLYQHPDWGKEEADAYYRFWEEQEYTQFDDGAYDDLFLQSDAIIHDCSSFIVEYAFTQKPCLYLVAGNHINDYLNEFGKGVIGVYQQAKTPAQIEKFVKSLVNANTAAQPKNTQFFNEYVERYYHKQLPSVRIVNDIKQSLGYMNDN